MATLFLAEPLAHLVPVLQWSRDVLRHEGIEFGQVSVCKHPPRNTQPDDFLVWAGEAPGLPHLPEGATGRIRSRKTGRFGLVHGRSEADFQLLRSRWDEVEAAGGDLYFSGSVSQPEQGADDLRWVIDRLVSSHSFSQQRSMDWERLERGARRRVEAAGNAREHFLAWSWLFARLKDGHTKLVALEGAQACARVHCGVYGRFAGRYRFAVERVFADSAAERAGIAPGAHVVAVNGCDWPTYLRREGAYWSFSSPHLRRACWRFMPWYQPAGTCLELTTSDGRRVLPFGDRSHPGFFHWAYEGRPEAVRFRQLTERRYRLKIAFFAGDDEFVPSCEEALQSVSESAELELDLRGNTGGNAVKAARLAGMFLPRGTVLSRRRARRVGAGFTAWSVYRNPDRLIYRGPLIVLMDERCASATEMVIGSLKAAGRARLVGRRSGGSSGGAREFLSSGGIRFTCSSWEETTPAGEPIEGRGIATRVRRRAHRAPLPSPRIAPEMSTKKGTGPIIKGTRPHF